MTFDSEESFWKKLLLNILVAVAGVVLLVIVVDVCLKIMTKHNREILVPDFSSMTVQEAEALALESNVRLDIIDSVFVKRLMPGAIYSQNPVAGCAVKKGRRVLVTINAVQPRMVEMPDLIGYSLRQAKTEIYSKGLNLRRISYIDDIATNNVIEQRYNGRPIAPGEEIESDSDIDLVLGLNQEDTYTYVPYVCGYKLQVAKDNIFDNSLNVGTVRYDESVETYEDSLNAVVFRQSPMDMGTPYMRGTKVNLVLTVDQTKLVVSETDYTSNE